MPELLTPHEVDVILRYPRGRSIKLAIEGRIPAIKLPDGEMRFMAEDISNLLKAGRRSLAAREAKADGDRP